MLLYYTPSLLITKFSLSLICVRKGKFVRERERGRERERESVCERERERERERE